MNQRRNNGRRRVNGPPRRNNNINRNNNGATFYISPQQINSLNHQNKKMVITVDLVSQAHSSARRGQGNGNTSRTGRQGKPVRGKQHPAPSWFDQTVRTTLATSCSNVVNAANGMTVKQILAEIVKSSSTRFIAAGSKKNGKIFMFGKKLQTPLLLPNCGLERIGKLLYNQHDSKKEIVSRRLPVKCGKKWFRWDTSAQNFLECENPQRPAAAAATSQQQQLTKCVRRTTGSC